jgi:hypothetical protein
VTYNTSVTMAANTCTKKGYTHIGWTTNSSGADDGHGWSNWSGTWAYDNGQYGITGGNLQLYPIWQAKTYTVKYSCGSGTGSVSNHTATFDTNFTIKTSGCTKNGYAFVGWTTNSNESNDGYNWTNWSGKWVYDDGQYGITNRTLQFYPMWNQCAAGSYSNGATCTKCPDGTYSNAGAASCTACPAGSYCSDGNRYSCPSGYTSNLNSKTINDCFVNVPAGKYIASAGSATQSNCAAGTYKAAHTVYYGSTSSCSQCGVSTYSTGGAGSCTTCPNGYTSAAGATAQNRCYINVSAGRYLATAKSTTQTSCATGTYKADHTVYYGSTSS